MALSRAQYNKIMRVLSERRQNAFLVYENKKEQIYKDIPEIYIIDKEISGNAVKETELLLAKNKEEAAKLRQRSEELRLKKSRILSEHGISEAWLSPDFFCPDCEDKGYIGTEKCHCFKRLESELLYENSGLPALLSRENFSTFDLSVFDDEKRLEELLPNISTTQRAYMDEIVLPKVRSFLKVFLEKGEGSLFMTGSQGTGKTFLTNCIAKEALDNCKSIVYESAAEMFDRFSKESFGKEQDEELSSRIKEIYNCELLIIDDLGTEINSSFAASRLFMLLNHRLLTGRSTIISSNLSLYQIGKSYGERIVSRIMESFVLIPFYGSDLRLRGGQKR